MRSSHGRMDNRLSRGISTYPLALTPRRAQIPESQRGGTRDTLRRDGYGAQFARILG